MARLQLITLSLPIVILFVLAHKKKAWLEILPSIFWFFFMSLPYFFLTNFLNGYFQSNQFLGILTITSAMFIGDLIGIENYRNTSKKLRSSNFVQIKRETRVKLAAVIHSVLFLIPLAQIFMTDSLPIKILLFSNNTGFDLANARQTFTKGSNLPILIELLIAWYIPLISALCLFFLWRLGYKKSSILWFHLIIIYSILGLEKAPLVFFVLTIFISVSLVYHKFSKIRLVFTLAIFFILLSLNAIAQVYVSDINVDKNFLVSKEFQSSKLLGIVTPSDTYRFDKLPDTNVPKPVMNIVYRTTLTPIDVSFRYYQYYSQDEISNRNLIEVLAYRESPKSTNIVGNWAFTKRFPSKYSEYIDAYASIDADSFSLIGSRGFLIVGLILVLLRYFFAKLGTGILIGKYIYGMSIAFFSYLPFQGGLQSMLVSKGLLILLLISWSFKKFSKQTS
jgi:hypothetical protein